MFYLRRGGGRGNGTAEAESFLWVVGLAGDDPSPALCHDVGCCIPLWTKKASGWTSILVDRFEFIKYFFFIFLLTVYFFYRFGAILSIDR